MNCLNRPPRYYCLAFIFRISNYSSSLTVVLIVIVFLSALGMSLPSVINTISYDLSMGHEWVINHFYSPLNKKDCDRSISCFVLFFLFDNRLNSYKLERYVAREYPSQISRSKVDFPLTLWIVFCSGYVSFPALGNNVIQE